VFRSLWQELGLDSAIYKLVDHSSIEFNIDAALFAMTLNRLLDPLSELGVSKWAPTVHYPAFEKLELQHYYRSCLLPAVPGAGDQEAGHQAKRGWYQVATNR
jgi:hypothetical protein